MSKLYRMAFGDYYAVTVVTVATAYGTVIYFAHPYLVAMVCRAVGCAAQ